jgi:DUF1016 N-terminal domain
MATMTLPRRTLVDPDSLEFRTKPDGHVRWSKAESQAWEEEGRALAHADSKSKWDIGEWVDRGLLNERPNLEAFNAFSFTLAAAIRITGLAESTLYRLSQVAREFPESRRREKPWDALSWSHFNEVVPIKDRAVQDELLDKAASADWSVSHLRWNAKGRVRAAESKERPPKLKPEELKQYSAFQVPIDRVSAAHGRCTLRVILLEPEFRFLAKLAKARKKETSELVRELLAELCKTHFQDLKKEVAEAVPEKKIKNSVRKVISDRPKKISRIPVAKSLQRG